MGAKQSTLTQCRKNTTVSETEKKTWWKKGRIRKTKNKSTELNNGVLLNCIETTEEFRGKDCYRYKSRVIKYTTIVGEKSIQEKGTDLSVISSMSENKKQNTNSPSESVMIQPVQDGEDWVCKVLPNSECASSVSYDEQNALNSSADKVLNDSKMGHGTLSSRLRSVEFDVEKSSTYPYLLCSSETEIINHQNSLNPWLGADSNSSSDTEFKAFNDSFCSKNHETQFINKLSFGDKKVRGDSCSSSMQSLTSLKTVDSLRLRSVERDVEKSSTYPYLLYSSETEITNHQNSLNSLLGADSKASSDTELKAFNDSFCAQNHETQFMNKLSFDAKKVGGDSCSNNMQQSLRYLETVDSCDDEETEHFMTSLKEVSSSYPDSDLYSDERSHRITLTSDESVSVSACGSKRSGPDSTILFKQADKYNDIQERHCQQLIRHSRCHVQSSVDQIIDKENVNRIDKHCENRRSVIKCQSICGETASNTKKTEHKSDEIEPETAQQSTVNIYRTDNMKCQYVSDVLDPHALSSNVQKRGEKSVQIEKRMPVKSVRCCETVVSGDTTQATSYVFSAVVDFNKATVMVIYYYQCHGGTTDYLDSALCTFLVLTSFCSSVYKAGYNVSPNVRHLHMLITTENYACKPVNESQECFSFLCIFVVGLCYSYNNIKDTAEVADSRKNCVISPGSSDAHLSMVKFVWEEGQKVICILYFLENIKKITLKLDNRKDSTMKERKQLADKGAILINVGKIDSTEHETIGKANLVQKSSLTNEYRVTKNSERNFSAQNLKENYDQLEILSEISALKNQNNIAENQTLHTVDNEKCENTASCKTKALKSKQTADVATNVSVEMVGIDNNKNGEEIDSCQEDEELSSGQGLNKLASDCFCLELEGQRNVNGDLEIAATKHDIKLSESVIKDSQIDIDQQSILKEGVESQGVKYLQYTEPEAGNKYRSFNSCIKPLPKNGVGVMSVDEVAIGSTKRMNRKGRNNIKKCKGKRNNKLIDESTNQQELSSAVEHIILSDKASRGRKLSLRKKHRFKKEKKKPRTVEDNDALKPTLGVKKEHSKTIFPKGKVLSRTFCKKCHQLIHQNNTNCRKCQSARGEIETDIFHNHVSEFDSGIASMISTRSLILSGMESLQNITSEGRKETRKQVFNELFNLGLLNQQLQRIIKGLNFDAIANLDHSIIAFPGLQSYFDSLRDGITPSLQERMTYEWLRLRSFSSYNGGGSPVHLAHGGFYHHQGNETRCFCCNVSYSNWTYTEDVQAVHRRISPDCPFVAQGVESNRNTPVESSNTGNQSQPPSTQQSGVTPSISNTETPGSNSSVTHGGFSFGSGMPGMSQTRTHELPRFSFYPDTSANFSEFRVTQGADQAAERADSSSQLTSQLSPLTIQQSAGGQQPSEEPISGNPLVVPTQPSQIARQTDGDAQLIVSAQQPPEANDTQQNTTGNQGTSGASSSRPPPSGTESADILPIGTLKHPRYGNLNVRMSSFASWPSHLNQTPRQMAYAGFFHPGVADFARCFCCGGGLRNWEADDDPMVEHARWYPRCEYINKLKGTHFVQAVLRRHREHMAERQREQERANDTSFTSPDPMTTEVAASLLEMGFTQERAREAILTVRRLRGRSEVTAEEVTAWMLDDDNAPLSEPTHADTAGTRDTVRSEERSEQRNVSASSSSSGSLEPTVTTQGATSGNAESSAGGEDRQVESKTASNDKTEVDSSADEKAGSGKADSSTSSKSKSKKGKKSKSRKGHSPSQGDIDTKSLKEENKLLKQMQVCKICMDKYVSVTFLPCGHLVCCEECARSMRKCPICRKRIKGQVKTFMS